MLTCDLYPNSANGRTSLIYPAMERKVGEKYALYYQFLFNEYPEFKEWYSNESSSFLEDKSDNEFPGGQLDQNGDPVLLENAYFKTKGGKKFFLGDSIRFLGDGKVAMRPLPPMGVVEAIKAGNLWKSRLNAKIDLMASTGIPVESFLEVDGLDPVEKVFVEESMEKFNSPYQVPAEERIPISFYMESENKNESFTLDQIDLKLPGKVFLHEDELKFRSIMSGTAPDEDLPFPDLIDMTTGLPFTYKTYYANELKRFKKDQLFLEEIAERVQWGGLLTWNEFSASSGAEYVCYNAERGTNLTKSQFINLIFIKAPERKTVWSKMTHSTGSSHKLVRQNFGALYREFSDTMATDMMKQQIKQHEKKMNGSQKPDQEDIKANEKMSLSSMEFSEKKLVMHHIGLAVTKATGISKKEILEMKIQLNNRMSAVAEDYWKVNGKPGWYEALRYPFKTFFHKVQTHNKPYLWMFEEKVIFSIPGNPLSPTVTDKYTGEMIKRFVLSDADAYAITFEKDPSTNDGYMLDMGQLLEIWDNTSMLLRSKFIPPQTFMTAMNSRDFTLRMFYSKSTGYSFQQSEVSFFEKTLKDMRNGIPLTPAQQTFLDHINKESQLNPFMMSVKQEGAYDFFDQFYRKVAARSMVISTDSPFFADLKAQAARGNSSAKNKLELYDYLYTENMNLTERNKIALTQPADKAFMPQLSMNTVEAYQKSGLMGAWLASTASMNTIDLFEDYSAEDTINGVVETNTLKEWKDYYMDPARTKIEKLKAPVKLNKLLKKIQNQVTNNKGINPTHRMQMAVSFTHSNTMPFRTLARKKDFSVNAGKLFMTHFESLIFRANHNPLVPKIQAVNMFYDNFHKKGGNQKAFENLKIHINDYADRYLFGYKGDSLTDTVLGNLVDSLAHFTILSYLALSPKTSALNALTCLNESMKSKIAEDGFSSGMKKFGLGMKRVFIARNPIKKHLPMELDPKAKAFIEYFNISTLSKLDIKNQQDMFLGMGDMIMAMQSRGEIINRGVSILGELTEKEWNSFTTNAQGEIEITDQPNFPGPYKVKEMNYYISSVQGNYSPEGKRNYQSFVLLRATMLFKGWMVDFNQERFRFTFTDMYSKIREGYYTTFVKLAFDYQKLIFNWKQQVISGKPLEQYQIANLRKLAYDAVMMSFLAGVQAGIEDDEDPTVRYMKDLVASFQMQLFIQFSPTEILGLVSRPFVAFGIIESLLQATIALTTGEFRKSGELFYSTFPGQRIIDFSMEIAEFEE